MDEIVRIDEGDGVWPPEGFTGQWQYHWPNGQLKYRAFFRDGRTDGVVTCYWENGVVAQKGVSENGVCRGTWVDYRDDGSISKETEYIDERNFVERYFDTEGKLTETVVWKDGEAVEESPPAPNDP